MMMRRLRFWLHRAERGEALRVEMEQHIEEVAAELQAGGMTGAAARGEALRRFGGMAVKQEEARSVWIARWWHDFWQDLRHGARAVARDPGFAAATVVALSLGIGLNAMLFNVYNALTFAPWAVRDASETVQVFRQNEIGGWYGLSWPHFRYLREHTKSLEGLAAATHFGVTVMQKEGNWQARALASSGNYFDLIGTGFAVGRGFSAAADRVHGPAAEIVLSYNTWQTHYAGDPAAVGRQLELNGHWFAVVGVAAQGFNGATAQATSLWIPAGWLDVLEGSVHTMDDPRNCCTQAIGRLKPGITRAAVQAELNLLAPQFDKDAGLEPRRMLAAAPTLLANPNKSANSSRAFQAMGVGGLLILLLACANVANLQLARALARRREIAVRLSLGAGRGRIVRQLLAEMLPLSALAGGAAAALSAVAPAAIVKAAVPPGESILLRFDNDWRVIAFLVAIALAAVLVCGLSPALTAVRRGTADGMREGGRSTSSTRLRSVLLATQVCLCTVLVAGTALLVRSLDSTQRIDPGFSARSLSVVSPGMEAAGIDEARASLIVAQLRERIAQIGGVEAVAHATAIPFGQSSGGTQFRLTGSGEEIGIESAHVSANYLETMGIPLVAGRPFVAADEAAGNAIAINQAAARSLWPGEDPLGKTIQTSRLLQVVAVVGDSVTTIPEVRGTPFLWLAGTGGRASVLVVRRTGRGPASADVRRAAQSAAPRLVVSIEPYEQTIALWRRGYGVAAGIATGSGMVALLLACIGIYSVAAYNMSQRTKEVGIRLALGARPDVVLALIVGQTMRTVAMGAALGLAGALAMGRLLNGMLVGVSPTDPIAITVSLGVLFATGVLAALGPACRAARVDPAITLRHD
jgi:predicted permease